MTSTRKKRARSANDRIIKLEELIASLRPRPTRALLLAFEASLPFVERVVLPALGDGVQGRVNIAVDVTDYVRSRLDGGAVLSAGIQYRVHPVRLPGGGRFHPKLYVLPHDQGAHVIIGSGNITPSGWRSNLEVFDYAAIDCSTGENERLRLQLADYLLRTAEAIEAGHADLAGILKAESQSLTKAAPRQEASIDSGAFLLHNWSDSLLSQIQSQLLNQQIRDIVAVSPFFDDSCSAIRQLAAAFPSAKLRVVKDGRFTNDLNGGALLSLRKRVVVEGIESFDAEKRPLHAKCLFFSSTERSWLFAGSANLTAAGLLRATKSGGNAELITVHSSKNRSNEGVTSLLAPLKSVPIALESLTCAPRTEVPTDENPAIFRILRAEETAGEIEIDWQFNIPMPSGIGVGLLLQSEARSATIPLHPTEMGGLYSVSLRSLPDEADEILADDLAIGATVTMQTDGVILYRAFAWLDRPQLLDMTNEQRRMRRVFARLSAGAVDSRSLFDAF